MKKLNLVALILGAALFLGFGATTASAAMKCGAGKCGSAMMDKAGKSCNKPGCECGDDCKCGDTCKCGEKKSLGEAKAGKCTNKDCECGDNCQCGENCKCGKNGNSKKAAMKCGAGKCGSKK